MRLNSKRKRQAEDDGLTQYPSKAIKDQIARDDARIEALERKLGIKAGRKSIPKAFQDDGLAELFMDDLTSGDTDERQGPEQQRQRKAEFDDWLAQKRKIQTRPEQDIESDGEEGSSQQSLDPDTDLDSEDTESEHLETDDHGPEDEFRGFDDSDDYSSIEHNDNRDSQRKAVPGEEPLEPLNGVSVRKRENPYIAPGTDISASKYVPPSLRLSTDAAKGSAQLERKLQGLLNRLTASNLQGVLKEVEAVYSQNPRGQVTSSLTEAILAQVCNPASLPDTFFVLNGGFVAAVYKVIGESFGSHFVTRVVCEFQEELKKAQASGSPDASAEVQEPASSKVTSNLVTLISELYVFQVVGSGLVFDLIRLLFDKLSETSTELLLRIARMTGKFLRRDDPKALQEVAAALQSAIASTNSSRVSTRTKFMIETITDLSQNRAKAGVQESVVVSTHVTAMKKILGTLNSRGVFAGGPLRIGLKDIEQADTRGKWWLVGARFTGPEALSPSIRPPENDKQNVDRNDDDELDYFFPDVKRIARAQGLRTDAQMAIFTSIVEAQDYNDAYVRFCKLSINKQQKREIAFVLLQCVAGEQPYNGYYALVAKRACADGRIRYAFQDRLWQLFRRIGESIFEDEGYDEDAEDNATDNARGLNNDQLSNIGRMIGWLIAHSSLSLNVLKCLDFTNLKPKTSHFLAQLLLSTLHEASRKKGGGQAVVGRIFQDTMESPGLSTGLYYFMPKVSRASRKSGHITKSREITQIKESIKYARMALETLVGQG